MSPGDKFLHRGELWVYHKGVTLGGALHGLLEHVAYRLKDGLRETWTNDMGFTPIEVRYEYHGAIEIRDFKSMPNGRDVCTFGNWMKVEGGVLCLDDGHLGQWSLPGISCYERTVIYVCSR